MGNNHIASRSKSGLSISQVGGTEVYAQLTQVRSAVGRAGLGREYAQLFTETMEFGDSLDWYADDDGPVVPVKSLPQDERDKVLMQFRSMVQELQACSAKMKEEKGLAAYAALLEKAVLIPDLDCLYLVDGKLVLSCWSMVKSDGKIVDGGDIIGMIDAVIKQPGTSEPPIKAPANPPSGPPNDIPEEPVAPPNKNNTLRNILISLGVLALAAALAWWFLLRPAPGPDMSFLKENIELKDVLADEKNRGVTLRMKFPGKDGIGTAYVEEENQTCEGGVKATLEGRAVLFMVDELLCPNKDNHESFELTCTRGTKNCTGRNRSGHTWAVELEIEK